MVNTADEAIQVIKTLLEYVNGIPGLPAAVELEFLQASPPAMMLQQLSGTVKYNEDIVGNYTAHFPFALYVRTFGTNEGDRIDAAGVLNSIGAYFDEQTLANTLPGLGAGKTITAITMAAFPSLVSREDGNTEIYQAVYRLEYEQNYNI